MKLGIVVGYSGATMKLPMTEVLEAERLGFDSVWTSEAWGSDAVSPAAWMLARTTRIKVGTAIMQMPARKPTCAAMTAQTLNALSDGRFVLGIGPSGPQVAEGWYGEAYGRPMTRTKEYISIIRKVLAREEPLSHEGYHYQIPYTGKDATGLGRPLKSILHGDPALRIYTASITPAGIRCSAEVADGFFPVWMNPERFDVFAPHLEAGFAKADGDKGLDDFDIAPFVHVQMGDDLDRCRKPVKAQLALYIGGMGARDKNFYNDYTSKLGYPADAQKIQDLYLSGKPLEATGMVPDELVDEVALVGSPARIRDQLQRWIEAGRDRHVGTLLASGASVDALRLLAEEIL